MATLFGKPSFLFLATLLALSQVGNGFLSIPRPSRSSLTRCQLQIPSDMASLFPSDATALLEGVSWTDVGLYGGIPLVALSFMLTKPPSKLISDQELEQITQGTNLQGRLSDVTCIYKASRDGWSATQFHDKVDTLGSAVVVARSLTGQVFGGYNPAGWRSTDDYITSTQAFLWARSTKTSSSIDKFPVLPGGNAAIFGKLAFSCHCVHVMLEDPSATQRLVKYSPFFFRLRHVRSQLWSRRLADWAE